MADRTTATTRGVASTRTTASARGVASARKQSGWDVRYEADALPDAATPAWVKEYGPTTTEEISPAGFLHIVSADANYLGYSKADASLNNTTGWTFETKLKVISASTFVGGGGHPTLQFIDDTRGFEVDIYSDQIYLASGYIYEMDTTDDYHVYHVTYKGTNVKVYVDGVLRINHLTFGNAATDKTMYFWPEYAGLADIETSWDYVYYRTDGAFEPI